MKELNKITKIPAGAIKNHFNLPINITAKGSRSNPPSRESIENADIQNVPLSIQQDKFIFTLITSPVHYSKAWKSYQVAYPDANEHAAKQGVARLLNNPLILKRAEEYFALIGLDEVHAQIKHAKLLHESEDKIAINALRLFYDLRGKIVAKTESTHLHISLSSLLRKAKESKPDAKTIDAEIEIEDPEST